MLSDHSGKFVISITSLLVGLAIGAMLREGANNFFYGAISVFSGFLGGASGLRIGVATKLLKRPSDMVKRLFVENIFVGIAKLSGGKNE